MDPPGGKHSDFERRASMRTSVRLSVTGDDEESEVPAAVVGDGWLRPTNLSCRRPSMDGRPVSREEPTRHETVEDGMSQPPSVAPSRPESIAKPPTSSDPLVLRDDSPALATALPQHLGVVESSAATSLLVQAEGPYNGPSGPSHPYQMYSQRAVSVVAMPGVTAPERSYSGPQEPAHPYGLYPQTTTTADAMQPDNIPVGFPGNSDAYQRRIGPEGEDVAGLVGPLGHTEELPPYSRYPDQVYARKEAAETRVTLDRSPPPAAAVPAAPTSGPAATSAASPQQTGAQSPASVEPISGAGGIGLATRDPEFSSTSDLDSPRSRLSARSFTSDESQHEINTAARDVDSEKEIKGKSKWQTKATKKMWGIVPYWAICLLAAALVLMGVILGAVIGTFLTKHRKGPPHMDDAASRSGDDVIFLERFPAGLPALETGEWSLPPLIASQAPSTCFNNTNQAQAWTCGQQFGVMSYMEVQRIPGERPTSDYSLTLTTPNSTAGMGLTRYIWGTAPPIILEPSRLRLVEDLSDPGYGPAWWLKVPYNKTVILDEDRFPGMPATRRRNVRRNFGDVPTSYAEVNTDEDGDKDDHKRKGSPSFMLQSNEGDKAWVCTWPGTVLEFFVYPAKNNSFSMSPSTFPMPTDIPTQSMPSGSLSGFGPMPTGSGSYGNSLGDESVEMEEGKDSDDARVEDYDGFMDKFAMPKMPRSYPSILKIRERRPRTTEETAAFCRQVIVTEGGQNSKPVLDEMGQPVQISIPEKLTEQEFGSGSVRRKRWLGRGQLFGRDNPSPNNECGCTWMVE